MPPGITRCFPLCFAKIQKFLVWTLGSQMPPLSTPRFSHTSSLSCTFSQPKILSFYPPPRENHFSASQNICVHRQPCLRLSAKAAGPSSLESSRYAAPSFSPWLQKRLHSLAKISPIMSTWAGRGVPQQQVPLCRAPHHGAGCREPRRSLLRPRREGSSWPRSLDRPLSYQSEGTAPSPYRRVLCFEPTEPNADP